MGYTYNIEYGNNYVIIKDIEDFDLSSTFDNGQCFRWNKTENDSYIGVAMNKTVEVYRDRCNLIIKNTDKKDFNDIWYRYFTLDVDYSKIKKVLSNDPFIKKSIEYSPGLRLLRQDFYETLISFILSSNNNIQRIKKIINNICMAAGNVITYENKNYYSFPDLQNLQKFTVEDFNDFGAGYRSKYLVNTIKSLCCEKPDLNMLENGSLQSARKSLQEYAGIGLKVADCILLYSGLRYDVFPADVWIRKIVCSYTNLKDCPEKIVEYAAQVYGDYAGFAQQYLFHYARFNL